MTAARTRGRLCWCGRTVATDVDDAIECAEHDDADRLRAEYAAARVLAPITHAMTFPQVGPPSAPLPLATSRSGDAGSSPSPDRVTTAPDCRTCGGDGFLFHLFAGAVELDGPCPDCTGKAAA